MPDRVGPSIHPYLHLVGQVLVSEDPPGERVEDVGEEEEGAQVDGDGGHLQHGDVAEDAEPAEQPQRGLGRRLRGYVEQRSFSVRMNVKLAAKR